MQAEDGVLLEGRMAEYKALFERAPSFKAGPPRRDGSIDRKDVADLAARLETPLTTKQTVGLIDEFCSTRECELEGSDRITFEEFLNMFRDHMLDLKQITEYLKLQAAPIPDTSPEEVWLLAHMHGLHVQFVSKTTQHTSANASVGRCSSQPAVMMCKCACMLGFLRQAALIQCMHCLS
jgi:hypothetical protein